jgi:hypothetical protein
VHAGVLAKDIKPVLPIVAEHASQVFYFVVTKLALRVSGERRREKSNGQDPGVVIHWLRPKYACAHYLQRLL